MSTLERRTLSFVAAFGIFTLQSLHPQVVSAAPDGCKDAELTGESHVDSATGAFLGTGTVVLDGHVHDVSSISVVTGVVANPDGTLTLVGSHHITSTHDGSLDFTTVDVVTAVPTAVPGEYAFSSRLDVVDGQGRIEAGFLEVEGWVDLVHGDVELHTSHGSLCAHP